SVTLLVPPEQVARLDLGQSLGMLSLSLRNPNDRDEPASTPATIADIRFGPTKPIAQSKLPNLLSSVSPALRATLPSATKPELKSETATTSILTLRGQTWGAVRVAVPSGVNGPPAPKFP